MNIINKLKDWVNFVMLLISSAVIATIYILFLLIFGIIIKNTLDSLDLMNLFDYYNFNFNFNFQNLKIQYNNLYDLQNDSFKEDSKPLDSGRTLEVEDVKQKNTWFMTIYKIYVFIHNNISGIIFASWLFYIFIYGGYDDQSGPPPDNHNDHKMHDNE